MPSYEIEERIKKEEKKIRLEAVKIAKEKGIKKGEKAGIKKGKKEGLVEGEEKGIKKGENKKALKMAKAMIIEKEPIDKIAKYTGLSIKEIEKL